MNPVLAYEWITSSRRWQSYAVRSCFVAALLGALIAVRYSRQAPTATALRGLAQMAELFFLAISGTQLALVLLAAPAATAGAICLDRARGTLSHMLMTDLSDSEIVLGKLAARLVPVLGLLTCMVPVMELLALLGGVDPTALLGGFLVSLGVAVLGCTLAMFFSLWVGKTHEALMGTYAVWALWLLSDAMISLVSGTTGWSLAKPARAADPFFLALAPYWWPNSVAFSDYLWFLAVTLSISAVLAGIAVLRLRPVCLREKVLKRSSRRGIGRIGNVWRLIHRRIPRLSPSLDGNPVLWREWHRSRPSRWTVMVTGIFAGASLLCSSMVILSAHGPACAWVNGFQVSIGLLLLSVAAATALAEERARGSMDLILSTPLSTREIVMGKWLGAYRVVPLLAVLPALVIARGALLTSWLACWVFCLLLIVYVLSAGAAITSLGLAMATVFSRPGRAVGLTVALYALVAAGWLALVSVMSGAGGSHDLALGSPFFWAGEVTFEAATRPRDVPVGWALFWTALSAWIAVRLLKFTLGQFDRRLGRIELPGARRPRSTRAATTMTKVYYCVGVPLFLLALNPNWAPAAVAFQFLLGSLLLTVKSAISSSTTDQAAVGEHPSVPSETLAPPSVFSQWKHAHQSVVPVIVPAVIVLLIHAPRQSFWFTLLVLVLYMASVGAAFVSISVLISSGRRRQARAIVSSIAVWAALNGGWLALAFAGSPGPNVALGTGSPIIGVSNLIIRIIHNSDGYEGAVAWALVWTVAYSALAAWLLRRALMKSSAGPVVMIPRVALAQLTADN